MSTLREHINTLKALKQKFGEYDTAFVTISQVTMAAHLTDIEEALDRIAELERQNAELRQALQALVDNGGIGPESMFHDARAALAQTRETPK